LSKAQNFQPFSKLKANLEKSYGANSVSYASHTPEIEVIPSGILAIDYVSGIGGWPRGDIIGVFGPEGVGKTSIIGYGAIAEAQKLGLNCVLIAVEPDIDKVWMGKRGIDVDRLLVLYPADGVEAVAMAYECCKPENEVDLILFDSLAAMSTAASHNAMEKGDPKARVGGNSLLVQELLTTVRPMVYRSKICFIAINQARDIITSVGMGGVKQPGGRAVRHHETLIVQLKRGPDSVVEGGTDREKKVETAIDVVATFDKNKRSEGNKRSARFVFNVRGDVGVDKTQDLINTAKRAGVFQGAYFNVPSLDKPIHGAAALKEHLDKNPKDYDDLRKKVLLAIPNVEAVDDEED
jgi:recombination protein RecA